MIDKYESSRTSLTEIKERFHSEEIGKINEDTTRFRYIDNLLTDCFNWLPTDIVTEESHEGKYLDYTISLFRPVAIVEAKKSGDYFTLPIGNKKIYVPLKTIIKDNPNTKVAIDQVSGYCHRKGIQVGVVTNGWQIVAFLANRHDSIAPMDGDCLALSSIDQIESNFQEVWNCLSKTGFENNYLIKKLLGERVQQLPSKLSSTISGYPGIKNRNPFQAELEIISDLVLEDVIKDKSIEKEFLQECYCKSGALSNYSLVSKEILSSRYNFLFEDNDRKAIIEQVASKKGYSKELLDLFAQSLSKRPILLIGDVGVGKSTFIENLLKVEAPNVFEKSITFKIDLGSKAIISLDIKRAILNIIKSQLKENYKINIESDGFVRHCYYVKLEDFKSSVKVKRLYNINPQEAEVREIDYLASLVDNEVSHLKKSLEHICKNQKKQIIIFIDNCDQRNDQDQETAFLVAQEFASDWPALVFVCLRPETFHRTKKSTGALSGYHTKAFTISPPRIDDVVLKRLSFAQKITSGEIRLSKLEGNTSFSKLHALLESFKHSLVVNPALYQFLDNISNGNVRKAIELIKRFFGSGHVDTEKILEITEKQGYYTIPIHELLRTIIFGDNIYYSPDNSEITNLFDVRTFDPKEHFIVPIILSHLFDYSENSRNQGFIKLSELYSLLQSKNYTVDQIDLAINFMYSKGLFETSQKGNLLNSDNQTLFIRITNSGAYHISFLIKSFTYIDPITVDTPIFDETYRAQIKDVMNINLRIDRVDNFIKYLDESWSASKITDTHFLWPRVSSVLRDDLTKIKGKITV